MQTWFWIWLISFTNTSPKKPKTKKKRKREQKAWLIRPQRLVYQKRKWTFEVVKWTMPRMCPLMHSPFKRIYECNDRNGLNRSVIAVLILLADPKWNLLSDEQQQQQQNNNMDLCMLRNFRAGGKASSWRRSSLFWTGKCGQASNRCHVTIRCRVHCPCVTKKNTSPKKNLSSPIKIIR